MFKTKTILSAFLIICLLFSLQTVTMAEETNTTESKLILRSSGVVYPDNENLSMTNDEDDYAWMVNRSRSSASIFQYDLTGIPAGATVVKAEWKVLVGEAMNWTAGFTSFECEETFTQSLTYPDAVALGYTHPNATLSNCFMTKTLTTSDYNLVDYTEYRGEVLEPVSGKMNQATFDMTREVQDFVANGKTKFNFGVVQNRLFSSAIRLPTAPQPAPTLVITWAYNDTESVDSYTTTRYNDYLVNLHPTSLVQIAAGIKGGEAGQAGQAIAISPSNPQIMVCGNDMAGVYSSSDGGTNWKNTSDGLMTIGVSDLIFDPTDSNIVLAMATTSQPRRSQYPGIYRSTDAGKTWTLVKQLPVAQRQGKYFAVGAPVNGVYPIYAGTNSNGILSGVYVSYDQGLTWKPRGLDTQVISDLYADGSFLAAATTTSGLFLSYDDGIHWEKPHIDSGLPRTGILSFVKDPANANHFYAITATDLYESSDAGVSWNNINNAYNLGVQALRALDMMEDPQNAGAYILYLTTSRPGPSVRYSTDGGVTFQKVTVHSEYSFMTDNQGYQAEPMRIDYGTKTIFSYFDGDLHKSIDGGRNFYPSMSGYSGMRARDFLFDMNDPGYLGIAQTDRSLMQTVDGYYSSEYRPFDYGIAINAGWYEGARTVWCAERDPSDSNHMILCMGGISATSKSALKRSTDGGETWSMIEQSVSDTKSYSGGNRIYFHPENNDVIYAYYLKSTDGGETWTELDYCIIGMSQTNGDIIYGFSGNKIYFSENQGETWTEIATIDGLSVRGTVDNADPYTLYMGTFSSGLYKINAKTKTKTTINHGMVASEGTLNIKDISQDPADPLHLVCGGANNYTYAKNPGFFESFDGGQNWNLVEGLPGSADVWTVEFHPNPEVSKVYLGTSAGTFVYEWKNNPANQ